MDNNEPQLSFSDLHSDIVERILRLVPVRDIFDFFLSDIIGKKAQQRCDLTQVCRLFEVLVLANVTEANHIIGRFVCAREGSSRL